MRSLAANSDPRKKKKSAIWSLVIIASIIFGPIFWVVGCFLMAPILAIYHADEGFKQAKKTADPEVLRAWALQVIAKNSATNTDGNGVIMQATSNFVPDSILHMYTIPPEDISITPAKSGHPGRVDVCWGGGFFHWWLTISETNNIEPYKSDNPEYPYNYEWVPGIYYSREADWPLL